MNDVAEVIPGTPAWPHGLDNLGATVPERLWWRGAAWTPGAIAVAVVGSRQASAAGTAIAHDLGRELASRGIVVVSGLARGIDIAAHNGAVAARGVSVGVCGCGVDVDYPRGQSGLRSAMLRSGGALVSEFAPGIEPRPHHFPQRNRIIAALAIAVVVVEASERSGALSTARWGADLGRDILAAPGPLHSNVSRGTNRLIRDGARPYLEIADVLDALGLPGGLTAPPPVTNADPIVDSVAGGPTHPDTIAATLGIGARDVAIRLAELEIAGTLRTVAGGRVEMVAPARPAGLAATPVS